MATLVTADFTFNTGKKGKSFSCIPTEASTAQLIDKGDHSKAACYIEYVQLTCASYSAKIYDGSAGGALEGMCFTTSQVNQVWDFKDDPLVWLTDDNTESICVSCGGAGLYSGFIKYYWGPKS